MSSPNVRNRKVQSASAQKVEADKNAKPEQKSESFLKKMIVRSVVGILMIVGFSFLLQLPHRYTAMFVVFAQLLAWNELVSLRHKINKEKQMENVRLFRTINWFFLVLALVYFYGKPSLVFLIHENYHPEITHWSTYLHDNFTLILYTGYVSGLVAFVLSLSKTTLRYQIAQLTWTMISLLMIVGQAHFFTKYVYDGLIWVLLPHGAIICNDISAYFFGVALGRKIIDRPLTSLSPNKTWEGFLGAMMFTLVMAFQLSPLFSNSVWLSCPAPSNPFDSGAGVETCAVIEQLFTPTVYHIPHGWQEILKYWGSNISEVTLQPIQIHAVCFALFASLIAPFGGFLASGIKRAYEKKDFDNLFPGHGGVLDRFDCQLMMCTFVYVYLNTFIKTSDAYQIERILSQIATLTLEQQETILRRLQEIVTLN